jgi:hypothetical protein
MNKIEKSISKKIESARSSVKAVRMVPKERVDYEVESDDD